MIIYNRTSYKELTLKSYQKEKRRLQIELLKLQDIVLETEDQIQEFLPEVLGQALARTWIDKRFLEAFYEYPEEILERGGVYLPDHISVEFMKKDKSRPKVVVYENGNKKRRKILELKLIMVAEE